jgi:hypothetical protein
MRFDLKILPVIIIVAFAMSCVKPFNPPAISSANLNMLVVDGLIIPGSASKIKLSRSLNITDTFKLVPERNAILFLEGSAGSSISFQTDTGGVYTSVSSFLPSDDQFRLRIKLQDGKEYLSDFVEVKKSPPIDSVEWEEKGKDINIYINTHDPDNQAKYYKWDFDETVEYHAVYDSFLDFVDGQIIFLEPDQYRYKCYKYYSSTNIAIGNSSALSEDIIRRGRVTTFPNDNSRIPYRYSINVKQQALTPEAYKYWQILQSNTEQSGNLFDPQPAQLRSNIHNVADPNEPVAGFFSISNITEKRIFIRFTQLVHRPGIPFEDHCKERFIQPEQAAEFLSDGQLKPAYFTRSGGLAIAPAICVDCRLQGGSTEKPPYW